MSKRILWLIIGLLVLSNIVVYMANQDRRISAYHKGYQDGHLDAIESKYTKFGWELSGQIMDEARRQASQTANEAHRAYLNNLVDQAIEQAQTDGYGWATGQTRERSHE